MIAFPPKADKFWRDEAVAKESVVQNMPAHHLAQKRLRSTRPLLFMLHNARHYSTLLIMDYPVDDS
ncbi:hypothetical protein D7Z94_09680 [Ulvibacterium marinum]|uniref:Uncharacterized protein n=1 Tax=Ulvibacterium marinum TaxID=2419782 RepID=A0A3B0C8V9_9FLAO|nr:hypothetical protein D7Z94_09680 [Ulvibacterium marinum]